MLSNLKKIRNSNATASVAGLGFKTSVMRKIDADFLDDQAASTKPVFDLISTIRRAEEKQVMAELSNKAKSAFLTNMRHEIRTPMGAIIGLTQIMLSTKLNDKQTQCMTVLQSSAEALMAMVEDLLDIGKIESNTVDIKHSPFNMAILLDQIIGIMSVKAQEKGIGLSLSYEADLSENFCGDSGRIRQIIINLLGNAIKFTDAGRVEVIFCAGEIMSGKRQVSISVKDMGIGIPKNKIDMIFVRFAQADASIAPTYGGTGLGLAISKALAENMGGSLSVTSEVGRGSTFALNLELTVQEDEHLRENVIYFDAGANVVKPHSARHKRAGFLEP
jgi:signal transduction histidine kinase